MALAQSSRISFSGTRHPSHLHQRIKHVHAASDYIANSLVNLTFLLRILQLTISTVLKVLGGMSERRRGRESTEEYGNRCRRIGGGSVKKKTP